MEKNYRWTAFTHAFENGTVRALYNSLRLRPVFVEPEMVEIIKRFGDGATPSEILATVSPKQSDELKSLLPALDEAKILADAEGTDDEIIQFFRDRYLGHPYVSIAYFILTDACNFGCKYCFVENRMPKGYRFRMMSKKTVSKGLDFFCRLIRLKPEFFEEGKTLVIYGGEPLINNGALVFLLEDIRRRKQDGRFPQKTEISMVTNAALVTPEVAQLLAEHKVNVAVSIDGDETATNSARQYKDGRPVFEDVVRGFNILRKEGANVGVSCTLSQRSVDDFDSTLETILERLKVDSLGFNIVLSGNDYTVSGDYDEKAAHAIIRAFETFRKRNVFEDRIMRKVDAFVKGELYAFDCGASGGGQIVIAPDGQVGICHGYLGSRKYFMTTVDDMEFNPRNDPVFMEWSRRSPLNMEVCRGCPALGICGGGCPLNADHEEGSIWGLDKRFCVHCNATLEWLIWDLYKQMSTKASSKAEEVRI
ncbi:FibroRumin system radical SAM peptide maturase [Patescibacteria group bacterium]|nr:FibroRumin system radical SAM peptide maturase [Patescibacteria group bacterium]MBU1921988.1 FibroRumin system radical SAM peptide maturase [Patescibacteria group bacterium]